MYFICKIWIQQLLFHETVFQIFSCSTTKGFYFIMEHAHTFYATYASIDPDFNHTSTCLTCLSHRAEMHSSKDCFVQWLIIIRPQQSLMGK